MTYFLDTNVIIDFLKGEFSPDFGAKLDAAIIKTSVICQVECFAFAGLPPEDDCLLNKFFRKIPIIGLKENDSALLKSIIEVRKTSSLPLPDAIIYATAMQHQATFITSDAKLLKLKGVCNPKVI